jgi:four helix bundle protein
MNDKLDELIFYQKSLTLWDEFWNDSEAMLKDIRGREIVRQMTKCVGSISANIEEGYGRGFGKEYPQFLRIARGSARESRGWYKKSKFLLPEELLTKRDLEIGEIIAMLAKTISTLENRK